MKPVPTGFPEDVIVGEEQLDCYPMPALPVQGRGDPHGSMLVRWTFTDDERARVARGEDITVTFPHAVASHAMRLWHDSFPATEAPR